MNELACGPDCPWPDQLHLEPRVYWIGDSPLAHGEDDERANDPVWDMPYCLCGHPHYLTCPRDATEGLMTWTIEAT